MNPRGSRILVAIRVATTPDDAFDLFTQEIGLWWQPNPLFAFTRGAPGSLSFEPGIGGRFIETASDGRVFEIGRIVEWVRGERLAFTWRQASFQANQETAVAVRFEAVGDETRVTVEHSGWDSVPQEHVARHTFPDAIFLKRHGEWWQTLLARFKRQVSA